MATSGFLGGWADEVEALNSLMDDLTTEVTRTRVISANGAGSRWPPLKANSCAPPKSSTGWWTSWAVRLRSDARGPRSGHRRKARRPGRSEGRGRHWKDLTERVNFDGRQPDRPGAQHRRRDDGGGDGDLSKKITVRREGRDPRAKEHHQHDGGPAQRVRLGSDPRGPRSRHRRQARRPGRRAGRGRHLEGPDRHRELHGPQPHRPGAQHRRRDDRRGQRRPVEARSRWT